VNDLAKSLPIDVRKIDHVAFATWDAVAHVRLLTDVLGATFVDAGDEQHNGFRWLQFQLPGGGKIEIIEPITRDGFLYHFLTRRGEGMHHVTVYVNDLAVAVEQLRANGYEPVDVTLASEFWKEAFLSPREANGVLIQLAQVPDPEFPNPNMKTLDEYLADRPNLRPD
jgi:methylmalonyl-CoA epimerase